jgi:hypothetical protein
MKAFLAAILVAVVAAIGAAYVLDQEQKDVRAAYTTSGVNLGDYGKN